MAARSRRSSRIQISVGPNARTMRGAAVLQNLLAELALVLLPRGMTPKWFSELARSAFVKAAADISKLRNGRVNHSRVAVQTGLTRSDVKRLLKQNATGSNRRGLTAVERVIDGWRNDPEFAIRSGKSKPLLLSGARGSFAHLVKKYGGDVTHRAVLDELRRIGAIQDSAGTVQLRRSLHVRQRNDFAFLSPVLPLLVDGLRLASKRDASGISSIQTLNIPADTELDLAMVRERCSSSAESMLEGLAHSLGTRSKVHRKSAMHSISVTILLVENAARRSQRKSRVQSASSAGERG
jgi:Family of unknown function (DUF6502)